ncbi:MAG: hypothetical protein RBU45_16605 [Myxococcota bacterium]|jgi:hypothetical protein|nr:hypothetical protein [Myxococcota bacterium]
MSDKSKKKDLRRSNSFTRDEIQIACDIFLGLLSRKDVSILVNRKEFNSLTARFLKMRASVREDEQVRRTGPGATVALELED